MVCRVLVFLFFFRCVCVCLCVDEFIFFYFSFTVVFWFNRRNRYSTVLFNEIQEENSLFFFFSFSQLYTFMRMCMSTHFMKPLWRRGRGENDVRRWRRCIKKKKRKREKKKNDLCHIPTCVYNTRRGFGLVFRAAIHCMSAHRSKWWRIEGKGQQRYDLYVSHDFYLPCVTLTPTCSRFVVSFYTLKIKKIIGIVSEFFFLWCQILSYNDDLW